MPNPFSITFGKKPNEYIDRYRLENEIIEDFSAEQPTNNVFIISGARGSGKTVMLNSIANHFEEMESWIVIRISSMTDMVHSLAAKLYADQKMSARYLDAKIDLSIIGLGVRLENAVPASDDEVAIEQMLKVLQRNKKRLLIAVDEAGNTKEMRLFSSVFQLFLGQDYPVFLLMTGLYEEIDPLQNTKSLTFLLRSPKRFLDPLNYTLVKTKYQKALHVSEEMAGKMAALVNGYSFGFQVLGYLYYKAQPNDLEEIYPEFDSMLADYVYEKIWETTTGISRDIVYKVAVEGVHRVSEIQAALSLSNSKFSPYRDRLIKRGILRSSERGELKIALPRLKEFILARQ